MSGSSLLLVFSLVFFISGTLVLSQTYEMKRSVHRDLLMNYSKEIRPVVNQKSTIEVNITLILNALKNFDEKEGVIHTVFGLALKWRDELIRWNPIDYDGTPSVTLPKSKVWVPSLYLTNSASNFQIDLGDDNTQTVRYSSRGTAFYTNGIITSSTCSPDVTFYPFDTHDCNIEFTGLVGAQEVTFRLEENISMDDLDSNSVWEIEAVSVKNEFRRGTNFVGVQLKIKRRPTFFIINILAPIVFLAFVNLLVFAIPFESGERISFAVTIFLSFTVFLTLVTDKMPQTSLTVSLFSIYLILILTYSSLIMLCLVFILQLYHTENPESAGVVIKWLIYVLEKRSLLPRNKLTIVEEVSDDRKESTNRQRDGDDNLGEQSLKTERMRTLAVMLDRKCGTVVAVFFILISTIFMSILSFA